MQYKYQLSPSALSEGVKHLLPAVRAVVIGSRQIDTAQLHGDLARFSRLSRHERGTHRLRGNRRVGSAIT